MDLSTLGWNPQLATAFAALPESQTLLPARVAREDRESYVVYSDRRALRAGVSGAFRHHAAGRAAYPAVGDWVAVRPRSGDDRATIHALLPRRSAVVRKAVGERAEQQLIAANVDLLLICCALDRDFNPRRIERYVTLAWSSGAAPLVLLTKADQCPDPAEPVARAAAAAPGADVLAVSVVDGRGMAELRTRLRPGLAAVLVGSSGVGKSSLINALLDEQRLRTGPIRAHDQRGRHTTTWRQLILIPGSGLLIDTPGMRELQAWADDEALEHSFADIETLAAECRFRDCRHEREPGCRIRAALASGELEPGRWSSYCKQLGEMRYLETRDDPAALAEQRRRWKVIHKAAQAHMRRKYGE